MRKGLVVAVGGGLAFGLVLASFGWKSPESAGHSGNLSLAATDFRIEDITRDEEIAALVPAEIAAAGVLRVGAELSYAPMEMLGDDGETPIGMTIDLTKAITSLMGLELEIVDTDFDGILPKVGDAFDIGMSSFTITPGRLESVSMVSYFMAGSQLAAHTGRMAGNEITSLCGLIVGVQYGTIHHDELVEVNKTNCTIDPVQIRTLSSQAEVTEWTTKGDFDLMYADSPIIADAIKHSYGQLEAVGPIINAAPYGVAIAKDDPELTEAIRAALQRLMDDGTLEIIATLWGNERGVIPTALVDAAALD